MPSKGIAERLEALCEALKAPLTRATKIQIESSKAIVVEIPADSGDVDPIYFQLPWHVAPDGAVAEETFRVMQ